MPATLLRPAAGAAVSALMEWPDDPSACAFVAPVATTEAAVAPASRQFDVLVCVWQAASPERANPAPASRSLAYRDEEDALTWEDAAWQ